MPEINKYGKIFSRIYDLHWSDYIDSLVPKIINYFRDHKPNGAKNELLDLGCGTARVSLEFLKRGFVVTGVDQSNDMLQIARSKSSEYITGDKAQFFLGDIREIEKLGLNTYPLAISTFDTLNHLNNLAELEQVFRQVVDHLVEDGLFIFDLNTEKELKTWEFEDIEDHDDSSFLLYARYFDEERRAYARIIGFRKREGTELYEKFDEVMINTVYPIDKVLEIMKAYFSEVKAVSFKSFDRVLELPEHEFRLVIIGKK